MRRLHVDRQATLAQRSGADRTDRTHDHRVQAAAHRGGASLRLGHLEHVTDLRGAGEQGHVGLARRDRRQRAMQRLAILGQRPSIHRHQHDLGAARLQAGNQITVGNPIFLNRDALAGQIGQAGQFRQQLAPGVGLRDFQRRFDTGAAQRARRFRPAHHGGHLAQCLRQGFQRVFAGQHLEQGLGADAGQKDDHVELTGQQPAREFEGRRIFRQRHLAHRRRHYRNAALALDKPARLQRHPAFESDDSKSGKSAGR